MLILITNDDGIYAPGLNVLKNALADLGECHVVAPLVQQSGVSSAFSFFTPLRIEKVSLNGEFFGHSISGTPADAVKIALRKLLPEKPALVVSGINSGENSGINVLYSGTIGAALEGAITGIPSVAVSLCWSKNLDYELDYEFAGIYARQVCEQVLKNGLPFGTLLNVNIPALPEGQIKGVKVVRQAESFYQEEIDRREDPRGFPYYWIGGTHHVVGDGDGTDVAAVKDGYIAITPIHARMTDYEALKTITGWNLDRK